MIITRMKLTGYLVGSIWQGCEAWKDLNYDITDVQRRTTGRMTLRDHVLAATNDGDFMGQPVIADGRLEITRSWYRDGRHYRVSKSIPLQAFPSVADMLHDDPDWIPECELAECEL